MNIFGLTNFAITVLSDEPSFHSYKYAALIPFKSKHLYSCQSTLLSNWHVILDYLYHPIPADFSSVDLYWLFLLVKHTNCPDF